MSKCIICSNDSHDRKYCYDCAYKRSNACSIIRQNSLKLIKLLHTKRYTLKGFKQFELYVNNIQAQQDVLKEYLIGDIKDMI